MFSANKTLSAFYRPQKPFGFVGVNRVLDVFAVRKQLKIFQPVVSAVKVLMVDLHAVWNRADKSLPHRAMNGHLSVTSILARAEPDVVVSSGARFNRSRGAVPNPRFTMLDVERSGCACTEKRRHGAQRRAAGKHDFGCVDLFGAKQFPSRYAPDARKIADFVKAFVAADGFPYLHGIDIKPVYVGGQA